MGDSDSVEILDVRKDFDTGKAVFLVKRKGSGKETWENSDTLNLARCNVFLVNKGFKPLGKKGLLERDEEERNEPEDEQRELVRVKKPRKEQYVLPTKKLKLATDASPRAVQIPKGTVPLSRNSSALPAIHFPQKAMKTVPAHILPAKQPTPPPSLTVSLVSSPAKSQCPQSAASPSKSDSQPTPPAKPLFGGLLSRAGVWDRDQPVKILGCREGLEGLEYAVLFASEVSELLHYQIVPHAELIERAPWLFTRFFVTNIKVESR